MRASWVALFALQAVLLEPGVANAQSDEDKSAARALGMEGQTALQNKDFATSADRFRRAVAIFDEAKAQVPPTLLLGLARASTELGRLVVAQEAYNRIVRQGAPAGSPAVFVQAIEEANAELPKIAPRIASVVVNVTGCPKPQVTIDGTPIPTATLGVRRPIDPGTHALRATAEGCRPEESTFRVEEGKTVEAALALKQDDATSTRVASATGPEPPVSETRPSAPVSAPAPPAGEAKGGGVPALALVGFGIGAAGLVTGAITGALAMGKHSEVSKQCDASGGCPETVAGDIDSYNTLGGISTAGFIVGGVGAAAGLVFLLTAPKGQAPPSNASRWVPIIGPTSVGAIGRF